MILARMPQTMIQPTIESALQHHQAGQDCRRRREFTAQILGNVSLIILTRFTSSGVIAHQVGRGEAAVELIRRAIALKATDPVYYCNLGEACRSIGRLDEAIAAFSTAAARSNRIIATAHSNLGNALKEQGKLHEALAAYSKAIQLSPATPRRTIILRTSLKDQGKPDEAVAAYSRAIQLKPSLAEAHSNLGSVLTEQGKYDEAILTCQRAIQLKPRVRRARNNLGTALNHLGKHEEAIAAYSKGGCNSGRSMPRLIAILEMP